MPRPWPSLAIRSNAALLVKPTTLLAAVAWLVLSPIAFAQDLGAPPSIDAPTPSSTDASPTDAGAPGTPDAPAAGTVDQAPPSAEDDDGGAEALSVEEVHQFDPYTQWLTGGLGFFRNSGVNGKANSYLAGGGLRYGVTLFDRFFADSNRAQDALVIEGGAFFYYALNFAKTGDSYTVIPLIGTIRYDLSFSEVFTLFFYAGWMSNIAIAASGNTVDAAQPQVQTGLELQSPAVGAGFFYRIGPNWDIRVDLGTDTAQLGLVLRF